MRVIILEDYESISAWTARYVADTIQAFAPAQDRPFVLGLPTGSSPMGTYKNLISYVKEGTLSFQNVVTFNMDEYVGLSGDHPQSFRYFMQEHFFKHIDIQPKNTHIPNGKATDLTAECLAYEQAIRQAGGIRLFLGGVGTDGHIAFNEPGSSLTSRTRIKTLTTDTVVANARFFDNNVELVPKTAITVGVGTIMDADQVVLVISGASKAKALQQAVEGAISHWWTVTALQMHPKAILVCDNDAASMLRPETIAYFKDIEKLGR